MTCLRVVGAIALLGLLAACDAPQVTEVTSVPQVAMHGGVVLNADGTVVARMLTTAEAIAFLEKRATEQPAFLDTPHESHSDDGTTTAVTFREILNSLKVQSQAPTVQPSQSAALDSRSDPPPPLRIVDARTAADDGNVGEAIPVSAYMDVDPSVPPTLDPYHANQTIRIFNLVPEPFDLPFQRDNIWVFPWSVATTVQGVTPCTYIASTTHSVSQTALGSASAQSSNAGEVREPPSR